MCVRESVWRGMMWKVIPRVNVPPGSSSCAVESLVYLLKVKYLIEAAVARIPT